MMILAHQSIGGVQIETTMCQSATPEPTSGLLPLISQCWCHIYAATAYSDTANAKLQNLTEGKALPFQKTIDTIRDLTHFLQCS